MQTLAEQHPRLAGISTFSTTIPGKLVLGLAATAVVAAAAHVTVPLPFTPVPLTLQPLAVLGVGLALGPVAGFLTMLAYLAEGAVGLPVFAPTGPGGTLQLFGATGGFLMAYPLVAALTGGLARAFKRSLPTTAAALVATTLATILLFVCGAGWLMHILHLTPKAAWMGGVAPFLPGGAVDIVVAAGVYGTLSRAKRIE